MDRILQLTESFNKLKTDEVHLSRVNMDGDIIDEL